MVLRNRLEPHIEPIFYEDSYGYRSNKSALDAVGKRKMLQDEMGNRV